MLSGEALIVVGFGTSNKVYFTVMLLSSLAVSSPGSDCKRVFTAGTGNLWPSRFWLLEAFTTIMDTACLVQ